MARLMTPGRSIFTANRRIAATGAIDPYTEVVYTAGDIKDSMQSRRVIISSCLGINGDLLSASLPFPVSLYYSCPPSVGGGIAGTPTTAIIHCENPCNPYVTLAHPQFSRCVYTILQRPPLCLSCLCHCSVTTVYLSHCPDIRFHRSEERKREKESESEREREKGRRRVCTPSSRFSFQVHLCAGSPW